jgi:hypothetical protein
MCLVHEYKKYVISSNKHYKFQWKYHKEVEKCYHTVHWNTRKETCGICSCFLKLTYFKECIKWNDSSGICDSLILK